MPVNIEIRGIEQVNSFLVSLPRNTNKEIMASSEEFMRFVQKSAKARAPRETGALASSINVKRGKRSVSVIVDSPYGYFQELGFTPHWIHSNMSDRRGGIVGPFFGIFPPKGRFIFVRNYKPFIAPALEMALSRLPILMKRAVERAIAKSTR